MSHIPEEIHLNIGAIIFPNLDQTDFTAPFEVLSRLPNSTFHILWKEKTPVKDVKGLILTPEKTLSQSPPLDLLLVPGGYGQEALMEDETVLSFIREQSVHAKYVFSVCTGALVCGAAGLLKGVRATTHWSAFHLLEYFGAIPVDGRVVIDGKFVSAAGVTAGIDGALRVAALLRGDRVAQEIQLQIQYAPEPPFHSGTPATAPPEILEAARLTSRAITEARLTTAKSIAARLGVVTHESR
ncbi:MAG: DJ-1/PfpI family protein [Chroococcidiopsidaceae cyanobacterium CP_BM_ER_R8_30]|nr:DJ-1/PfpI family protein [Chroococcidiopsidaceae cyanobacterium CP_BM_ER_R8_30]